MKLNPYQDKLSRTRFADGTISLKRAKVIMKEEGIDYSDEELEEVLAFISEIVIISSSHYYRMKKELRRAHPTTHES